MAVDISELHDFTFLPYSDRSSQTLADDGGISVKHSSSWSYCGPLLSLHAPIDTSASSALPSASYSIFSSSAFVPSEADSLPPTYHAWASTILATGHKSAASRLRALLLHADQLAARNGLAHYWITVRATRMSHEFDAPRWHTDGDFFRDRRGGFTAEENTQDDNANDPKAPADVPPRRFRSWKALLPLRRPPLPTPKASRQPRTDWKLCAALLGPQTLFLPAPLQSRGRAVEAAAKRSLQRAHACTTVSCAACGVAAAEVRERLNTEFVGVEPVSAGQGRCAVFRTGEAVHSEPPMGEGDRVFVNVVPGTEEGLRGLMESWGMGFPWCWAMPTGEEEGGFAERYLELKGFWAEDEDVEEPIKEPELRERS